MRKSKYIESVLGDSFIQIKEDLSSGNQVIFCGTPCQVSGLRRYLGKSWNNLFTIDLICHGVGSAYVFEKCIDLIGEQFHKKVKKYEFRAKRGYYETDYLVKVEFEDGTIKYLSGDPYMQLFLRQDCLRPSCGENCEFRCEYRQGDITIADFKNLYNVFPDLVGVKKNYSSIIANTKKGCKVIEVLKKNMEMRECDINIIKKYNPLFCRQTVFSECRDGFFRDFVSDPFETIKKNTHSADVIKGSLLKAVIARLPLVFRRFVIRSISSRRRRYDGKKCGNNK